jgi:hypothetical protein
LVRDVRPGSSSSSARVRQAVIPARGMCASR